MTFLMFISFFTSRVVLDKLGVEDFGISNVVGGLAVMFVFFSSSMANATQRFINIELGKQSTDGARKILNQHLIIYCIIVIFVLIAAETFGLWIVKNKLTIPESRISAAVLVYQFTIISLCVTILGVVFNSLIIAHENMKVYSYIGVVEGAIKLGIAYMIGVAPCDNLIFYSFSLALLVSLVQFFYLFYCFKNYEECSLHWNWNTSQMKETFLFIGWNTVGTAVYAINSQGINILLNIFFGPIVNAARGIAFQVDHAVNNFSNNFFTAVRPQITKAYASQDFYYLNQLFFQSSKYSFFLLWIICLPLFFCIDFILSIWLVDVPEWTNVFTIWVLAYSLINVFTNPIWSIILAVGKLRKYISIGSAVYLLVFPISYEFLRQGCSPVSVFVVLFVLRCIYVFIALIILHSYVSFSFKLYIKKIVIPCAIVVCTSVIIPIAMMFFLSDSIAENLLLGGISMLCAIVCIWFLGMSSDDKLFVKSLIKSKLTI